MSSLQVTAAQGGFPVNGLLLRVTVLTGAAAVQPAAAAVFESPRGPAAADFTTTAAGARIYGALFRSSPLASFTAAPGTVLDDNVLSAATGRLYGTCKTIVASPGTVTAGTSAPSAFGPGIKYTAAFAEIAPDGTLAEDPSSPPAAFTEHDTTVTTASFTPPAGALILARVSSNGGPGNLVTMTVDGGGLTWSPLIEAHPATYFYAGVHAAQA